MSSTAIEIRPVSNIEILQPVGMQAIIERRNTMVEFVKQAMVDTVDFGVIPGTKKKTLLKPGAEKLLTLFRLTPRFEVVESEKDWTGDQHNGEAFFYYLYRCRLFYGDLLIAEGDGSCNSWEKKYRYRKAERVCPYCKVAAIYKSKNNNGGWYCWSKKDGCGAQFDDGDQSIEKQEAGQTANSDIADQVNTIQKMAQKRALIAATLLAVNASEFFTQDLDDQIIPVTVDDQNGDSRPPVNASKNAEINVPEYMRQIKTIGNSIEMSLADIEVFLLKNNFGHKLSEVSPDNLQVVLNWIKLQQQNYNRAKQQQQNQASKTATAPKSQAAKPATQSFNPPQTESKQEAVVTVKPTDPIGKSVQDLISPRQSAAIQAICRSMNADAHTECEKLYKCKLPEISRNAASYMIEELKRRTAQQQPVIETTAEKVDPQAAFSLPEMRQQIIDILPSAHTAPAKMTIDIKRTFGRLSLEDCTREELQRVLKGYQDKAARCSSLEAQIVELYQAEAKHNNTPYQQPPIADLNENELVEFLRTTQSKLASILPKAANA